MRCEAGARTRTGDDRRGAEAILGSRGDGEGDDEDGDEDEEKGWRGSVSKYSVSILWGRGMCRCVTVVEI